MCLGFSRRKEGPPKGFKDREPETEDPVGAHRGEPLSHDEMMGGLKGGGWVKTMASVTAHGEGQDNGGRSSTQEADQNWRQQKARGVHALKASQKPERSEDGGRCNSEGKAYKSNDLVGEGGLTLLQSGGRHLGGVRGGVPGEK